MLINSCSKCLDCEEGGVFDNFILVNNSNYKIEFYEYDTFINKRRELFYVLNKNDSLLLQSIFKPPYVDYPVIYRFPTEIVFDNKKSIINRNPLSNFGFGSVQDTNKYKGVFNYQNYKRIPMISGLPSQYYRSYYYFTEKDYLMADSIIN